MFGSLFTKKPKYLSAEEVKEEFFDAVHVNNVKRVKQILDTQITSDLIEMRDDERRGGYVALFIAARKEYVKLTKILLDFYKKFTIGGAIEFDEKTRIHLEKRAYAPEILELFDDYLAELNANKKRMNEKSKTTGPIVHGTIETIPYTGPPTWGGRRRSTRRRSTRRRGSNKKTMRRRN